MTVRKRNSKEDRKMKKKYLTAGLLALVLIVFTGVKPALAYFTGTASASGGQTLNFGYDSTIEEKVEDLTKTLTLTNTGETDVYVRARAFVGEQYSLKYDGTGNWTPDEDGWFVYNDPVAPGEAAVMTVTVCDIPETMEDGDKLNVAVVYECTPVQYKADGTPYADWSYAYRNVTEPEGGNG